MRVRCITNSGQQIPESSLYPIWNITRDSKFPLTIGREYVVHAVSTNRGQCWYYVFDDHDLPYPVWKLAVLFDVSDPRLPPDWEIGYIRPRPSDQGFAVISFPEWAHDRFFYERLVDRDLEAVSVFARRRQSSEAS